MKKRVLKAMVAVAMSMMLVACGSSTPELKDGSSTETKTSA